MVPDTKTATLQGNAMADELRFQHLRPPRRAYPAQLIEYAAAEWRPDVAQSLRRANDCPRRLAARRNDPEKAR